MMKTSKSAPWDSPINSKSIFEGRKTISNLQPWKDGLLFLITEPSEGNINVLMYSDTISVAKRVSPKGMNIRSKVHEYGGRPFIGNGNDIYYCNFDDQEIYTQSFKTDSSSFSKPTAVTDSLSDSVRYVDLIIDQKRNRLLAVREDHRKTTEYEAKNSLIALTLDRNEFPMGLNEQTTLFEGSDFVSSPNLSGDGENLAFITWSHPNMPWDCTELIVAKIDNEGKLTDIRNVDEKHESSKTQPSFVADNQLFFLSDHSGYWNLRRYDLSSKQNEQTSQNIYQVDADCCGPPWVTGKRNFCVVGPNEVAISVIISCQWKLHLLNLSQKTETVVHSELGTLEDVVSSERRLFYLAADHKNYAGIYYRFEEQISSARKEPLIQPKIPPNFSDSIISEPQHLTFQTENGKQAHGIYYSPKNHQFKLSQDVLPPLLINVHGGPTGTAQTALNPMHQFWTSRGFAVFDLNHRGSAGYGRAFRKELYGEWGVADVSDTVHAIEHLVEHGLANANQIAIRGGSAGGYLVLACLAESNLFSAGVSYYGIADLELLTKDTHKFESQYLERLIGPYPEKSELYKARSPINKLEHISTPVLIFQGKLDRIVPPNQAQLLHTELLRGNPKTEIVVFEDEGHGFRKPRNQITALNSELAFYKKNFF